MFNNEFILVFLVIIILIGAVTVVLYLQTGENTAGEARNRGETLSAELLQQKETQGVVSLQIIAPPSGEQNAK